MIRLLSLFAGIVLSVPFSNAFGIEIRTELDRSEWEELLFSGDGTDNWFDYKEISGGNCEKLAGFVERIKSGGSRYPGEIRQAAEILDRGLCVESSPSDAAKLFSRAFEQNNGMGLPLAWKYFTGHGVELDIAKAEKIAIASFLEFNPFRFGKTLRTHILQEELIGRPVDARFNKIINWYFLRNYSDLAANKFADDIYHNTLRGPNDEPLDSTTLKELAIKRMKGINSPTGRYLYGKWAETGAFGTKRQHTSVANLLVSAICGHPLAAAEHTIELKQNRSPEYLAAWVKFTQQENIQVNWVYTNIDPEKILNGSEKNSPTASYEEKKNFANCDRHIKWNTIN